MRPHRFLPTLAGAASKPVVAAVLACTVAVAGAKDEEPVAVTVTLSGRDAAGKESPAPNVKLHVTKLSFDPVTQENAQVTFPLKPGDYTLTTVTGRLCRFPFSVAAGHPLTIALVVPASGSVCQRAAAASPAASAPSAAASGASAPASHASASVR